MSLLAMMSAPLLAGSAVTADFGGYKYNNLGSRWTRYDYLLTNSGTEPQQLSVCPSDIEISVHSHRVERENAFALSFDNEPWSYGCEQRQLAPGETVTVGAFFLEWWTYLDTSRRRLKLVKADTNLGTYTLRFECPEDGDRRTCTRLLGG